MGDSSSLRHVSLRFILMHSFENVGDIIEILDQVIFSNQNITMQSGDDRS